MYDTALKTLARSSWFKQEGLQLSQTESFMVVFHITCRVTVKGLSTVYHCCLFDNSKLFFVLLFVSFIAGVLQNIVNSGVVVIGALASYASNCTPTSVGTFHCYSTSTATDKALFEMFAFIETIVNSTELPRCFTYKLM